jgi:hypothetical protein
MGHVDSTDEREPPAHLEARIVSGLRREGILRSTRWYRRFVPVPIAAAAALILFAGGLVVGRVLSAVDNAVASAPTPESRNVPADSVLVAWM